MMHEEGKEGHSSSNSVTDRVRGREPATLGGTDLPALREWCASEALTGQRWVWSRLSPVLLSIHVALGGERNEEILGNGFQYG